MASTEPNRPTHDVCFVTERGEGKKSRWDTIGAAWTHKDNGGLNLQLDFLPADFSKGRLVVRVRTEKPAEGEGAR